MMFYYMDINTWVRSAIRGLMLTSGVVIGDSVESRSVTGVF